jgi:hypothetical protein
VPYLQGIFGGRTTSPGYCQKILAIKAPGNSGRFALQKRVRKSSARADQLNPNYCKFSPEGCFAAFQEGDLVGTVTVVTYGKKLARIGMMILAQRYRGRGLGVCHRGPRAWLSSRRATKPAPAPSSDQTGNGDDASTPMVLRIAVRSTAGIRRSRIKIVAAITSRCDLAGLFLYQGRLHCQPQTRPPRLSFCDCAPSFSHIPAAELCQDPIFFSR